MTIVEAFSDPRFLSGEMWATRVGQYAAYQMFRCSSGLMTDSSGDVAAFYADDFTADWELVEPNEVKR